MQHTRCLLRLLGLAAAAGLLVSACGPAATAVPPSPVPTSAPTSDTQRPNAGDHTPRVDLGANSNDADSVRSRAATWE